MLKVLEEPLPRTLWILAATQRERLPRTIASRCFTVPFGPLPAPVLERILSERGVKNPRKLAALCDGSAGRALEFVDEVELAVDAADRLPRDLAAARVKVERALFALAQELRLKHLDGERSFSDMEKPLRELSRLRAALRANADPKLILTLAALEAESVL
jgi:hypothetical protein